MSISLIQQPTEFHSSRNTNWWVFQSDMRFAPRFGLKVDVKDGSSLYNSLLIPSAPNTYNILDIKNVMSDYVIPDFNCFITTATPSTCVRSYNILATENFEGLWVFATSSAGVLGTLQVRGNTTISTIDTPSLVEEVDFVGGPISNDVGAIYVWSYGTASTGFVNSIVLSQSESSLVAVTASVGVNSSGYLILNEYSVFSNGATYSTSVKKAVLSNIDYLDWNMSNNFNGYIMPGGSFLTKSPRRLDIGRGEVATLSYLGSLTQSIGELYVVDNLGLTYSQSIPSSLTQSIRVDIPTGTQNLGITSSATSYCVTLRNGTSIVQNYAQAFFTFDGSDGWSFGEAVNIDFGTFSFHMPTNLSEWSNAEDLYDGSIGGPFLGSASNASVRGRYGIVLTATSSTSLTFRLTAINPGAEWNFTDVEIITEGISKIDLVNTTSGAPTITYTDLSETICYDIKCLNSWSDSVRLTWLNSLGGIDYYTFRFIETDGVRIDRTNFDRSLNWGFTRETRENTTYKLDYYNEYLVVSNLVDDGTSAWLSELFTSPEVYWIREGELIPITVITDSYNQSVGFTSNEVKVGFRLSRRNR